tara:strand:- start:638 stop:1042 length:405 start_codon:yes stop_codon:yes gene_type:complete
MNLNRKILRKLILKEMAQLTGLPGNPSPVDRYFSNPGNDINDGEAWIDLFENILSLNPYSAVQDYQKQGVTVENLFKARNAIDRTVRKLRQEYDNDPNLNEDPFWYDMHVYPKSTWEFGIRTAIEDAGIEDYDF